MTDSRIRAQAKWVISSERDSRNRRAGWTVELLEGGRLALASPGGFHPNAREAKQFIHEVCAGLPRAEVRLVPTIAERTAAAEEKRSRLVHLQEAIFRQAREDRWTQGDWDDFLAGFEDKRYGSDLEDESWWAYEEDEETSADPLTWEVQQEGGRPQAVLLRGRVPLLSTVGSVHMGDAEALIEWARTDAVTKAPIEEA
jgi:hypothetical protein